MTNKKAQSVDFFINEAQTRDQQNYSKLLNAKATNALATIPTSSRAIKSQFTYHPEIEAGSLFTADDVKVTIKDFESNKKLGNAIIFYYYLLCAFTKQVSYKENSEILEKKESREVYFDIETYLKSKNLEITKDNKKNSLKAVKEMYETLKHITLDFEETTATEKKKYSLELFGGKGTVESFGKRSKSYFFILNYDLVKYLAERNYLTYIHNNFMQIDVMRHPNALSILIKLSSLYSMNYWKTNKGLVSFENLILAASDIPTLETVAKTNRHYFNRIVEPLEKDLDHLKDLEILKSWEYTNKNRQPLTDEQLKSYDYKTFKDCYIHYELADYPENEMLEFKQRQETKKANRKSKKKDSSKPKNL